MGRCRVRSLHEVARQVQSMEAESTIDNDQRLEEFEISQWRSFRYNDYDITE